jgi:hypothetical protein
LDNSPAVKEAVVQTGLVAVVILLKLKIFCREQLAIEEVRALELLELHGRNLPS